MMAIWTLSYYRTDVENKMELYETVCGAPESVGFLIEGALKDKGRCGPIRLKRADYTEGDFTMEQS